mmetsp:Transcript_27883/g.70723  ORF Transcript_27883/g.70723 Transcript_27883/m.70723 type:complete len:281 (-) Transcript_27883:450-1292(-)
MMPRKPGSSAPSALPLPPARRSADFVYWFAWRFGPRSFSEAAFLAYVYWLGCLGRSPDDVSLTVCWLGWRYVYWLGCLLGLGDCATAPAPCLEYWLGCFGRCSPPAPAFRYVYWLGWRGFSPCGDGPTEAPAGAPAAPGAEAEAPPGDFCDGCDAFCESFVYWFGCFFFGAASSAGVGCAAGRLRSRGLLRSSSWLTLTLPDAAACLAAAGSLEAGPASGRPSPLIRWRASTAAPRSFPKRAPHQSSSAPSSFASSTTRSRIPRLGFFTSICRTSFSPSL